MLTKLKLMGN